MGDFYIESDRLRLIPLSFNQLLLLGHNIALLEQALGLNSSAMVIDPQFKAEIQEAMQNFWLPNTQAYPGLFYWYTNWQVVLKSINTIVGGIGFAGYPDDYGETSIGYMIDNTHKRMGYATEAVLALSKWGFNFSVLKAINADTSIANEASKRVLLKAGFKPTHHNHCTAYFKLNKFNAVL